jgi:hypothetical protein
MLLSGQVFFAQDRPTKSEGVRVKCVEGFGIQWLDANMFTGKSNILMGSCKSRRPVFIVGRF